MGKKLGSSLLLDSLYYVIGTAVVQSVAFFAAYFLMKYLAIDDFGYYSYVIEFIAIFQFFSDAGLTNYAVRELSLSKENAVDVYKKIQGAQMYVSAFLFLIIIVISYFNEPSGYFYSIVSAAFGISGIALCAPCNAQLIANHERGLLFKKNIIESVIIFLFFITGIIIKAPVQYFILQFILRFLIAFLFFAYLKRSKPQYSFFGLSGLIKSNPFKIISAGFVFTILMVSNVLYNKVDIIMIQKMLGEEQVAYYAGATRFIYPFMFISGAFMTVVFPYLVKNSALKEDFIKTTLLSVKYLAIVGLAISLFLTFTGPYIYNFFFKHKFDASLPIFRILVWYLFLVFTYGPLSNAIVALNKVRFLIIVNVFLLFLKLIVNYLVLPKYGGISAAYITISCEVIILFTTSIFLFIKYYKNDVYA